MSFLDKLKGAFGSKKSKSTPQDNQAPKNNMGNTSSSNQLSKQTEGLFKEAEVQGQSEDDITKALDLDELEALDKQ